MKKEKKAKEGMFARWMFKIQMWWKQWRCDHDDTGIHSYPFTHPFGQSIRYGIWQRRVCLKCGKVMERGHAWQTGLSENKMKQTMRRLGHAGRSFSIQRQVETLR